MSKLNPQTKRRIQLPDAAFFLAFVCLLAYFIFLAPYGWAGSDEAFYVAEPYRFVQGDCFFTDDWNCGQLFAFALIPLMKLRLALEPSTDGIILSFRYYYVTISAAVTLFIYLRGRRISPWGALFAALFLLVYSPLGIRNMSYNVMGLMSLALVCVLMLTAEKHPAADMYFAVLRGCFRCGARFELSLRRGDIYHIRACSAGSDAYEEARTRYRRGLLGSAPIMPLHDGSAAEFIARGGRIPAPLHSLKN